MRYINPYLKKKSVILVGASDSGKSYYAQNNLLPFLLKSGLTGQYLECDKINLHNMPKGDFVIIDEVESLQDKAYLEARHPEENPYYSQEYLNKIEKWSERLKEVNIPCIYIITRNEELEIDNFINTVSKADWDSREVRCFKFDFRDRIVG